MWTWKVTINGTSGSGRTVTLPGAILEANGYIIDMTLIPDDQLGTIECDFTYQAQK